MFEQKCEKNWDWLTSLLSGKTTSLMLAAQNVYTFLSADQLCHAFICPVLIKGHGWIMKTEYTYGTQDGGKLINLCSH